MMPVLVLVCVRSTGFLLANATLVVPRNQLATANRAVQHLGVDMSRRYWMYVILPLLFSNAAQVFHAALLARM